MYSQGTVLASPAPDDDDYRCFICETPGNQKRTCFGGAVYGCDSCDVEWTPGYTQWQAWGSEEAWKKGQASKDDEFKRDYHFDEFVDFTRPDAPGCPV
jgi:hypothetical protein